MLAESTFENLMPMAIVFAIVLAFMVVWAAKQQDKRRGNMRPSARPPAMPHRYPPNIVPAPPTEDVDSDEAEEVAQSLAPEFVEVAHAQSLVQPEAAQATQAAFEFGDLKRAIILNEVLGKPLALRRGISTQRAKAGHPKSSLS